jgi:homoserine kinase type II
MAERLAFIHACQRHWRGSGLAFIPVPMESSTGRTLVEHQGHLWELATWMPGRADYREHPSPARLAAAMQALARIHQVAVTMVGQSHTGTSPGLAARLDQIQQLLAGDVKRIETAEARRPLAWVDLAQRVCEQFRRLAPRAKWLLQQGVSFNTTLFPCLRDIWHDHILFDADEVSGVIDYGAVRVESPAGDIARLVGSLVGDKSEDWHAALEAYQTVRPLDAEQRQLTHVFDFSGVLLSGVNWITWLFVEGREFEDTAAVTQRLQEIVARLERFPTVRSHD